ncbi:11246_t:CDS:2 [Acaulospora morrowiae]|uniref:11246_t:CDS:1 n=1 Tax=Acaulospora morrowiae TaxID=94023 RepID=A0A9N8YZC2_9GLOM|nr:11246_t:CDS:2 [Acaulospora morrowiae]
MTSQMSTEQEELSETIKPSSIQQSLKNVSKSVYTRLPHWMQNVWNSAYEVAARYSILKDFSIAFASLSVLPLAFFLIWVIGSLVATMVIGVVVYLAVNGLAIGAGFLLLAPILFCSLIGAALTTCLTTSIILVQLLARGTIFRHIANKAESVDEERINLNHDGDDFLNADALENDMSEFDEDENYESVEHFEWVDKWRIYFGKLLKLPRALFDAFRKVILYYTIILFFIGGLGRYVFDDKM